MLPQSHPKKKKNFIYNQSMGPCVIIFTVMMPTNCVILEYLYFDWNLEGFNYKLQTFLLFFVYIMAMWSYYKAVTIKNDTINKPAPPMDNRDIDMLYKNTACCLECNKWKPIRAHHCSMCGKCNAKMDHHCPWIANCVGLRNHRAFYLFTFYMMIGAVQYSWRSYAYFSKLYYSDSFFSESTFFYLFWSFTSIVLYPTAIMLSFLFCYHSILIVTNQTTIEQMKNSHQKPGCFSKPDRPHAVNIYDRGYIANIAWFFDYSYFWWMPFENVYENDGTNYPITPLCTVRDVHMTDPNYDASIANLSQQIDFTNINEKYQEYIEQAKTKYKGKRLQLHDRIIQIE